MDVLLLEKCVLRTSTANVLPVPIVRGLTRASSAARTALKRRLARLLALGLLLGSGSASAQTAAWLDGDPAAIWQRPPGFYQDGSCCSARLAG